MVVWGDEEMRGGAGTPINVEHAEHQDSTFLLICLRHWSKRGRQMPGKQLGWRSAGMAACQRGDDGAFHPTKAQACGSSSYGLGGGMMPAPGGNVGWHACESESNEG